MYEVYIPDPRNDLITRRRLTDLLQSDWLHQGRISRRLTLVSAPAGARCVLCGKRLPLIGLHPFAIEVGKEDNLNRFRVHAQCFQAHMIVPAD